MLQSVAGVRSGAGPDQAGRRAVIDHLMACGAGFRPTCKFGLSWKPPAPPPETAQQVRKIRAILAKAWQRDGVSLEDVQRATLLGGVRNPMALIEHARHQPIRSLRYFERRLEKVREEPSLPGYSQHLEFNLKRSDQYRQTWSDTAQGRARAAGK